MTKSRFLGSGASSALIATLVLAAAGPARAQAPAQDGANGDPAQTQADTSSPALADDSAVDDSSAGEAITVTGSRIRRPNLESTVPIASIAGESLFQQGKTNIGDTLNELPQLRSTFAQQNPGLGVGIAGLNLLDLRGLGTQRTLVLVNGRRHVAADILNNGVSPDINTIPNDLIDRVDIVTGGNSAVYGSDAIAGVVNFVLKRDFDGFQLRGLTGVSMPGGWGGNQYVSGMFGTNFGGGRGNITLHAEYSHQDRVFGSEVPFLRRVDGLGVVDSDPAGTPNGSDGNPDRVYFRDVRLRSINRLGLVPITQPAGAPLCGLGVGGTPYNCTYIFAPDGSLAPQVELSRFSTGVIGGAIGGNGQTGREIDLLSVLPFQNRYNFNLLAHYEFAPALEAFVEGKFTRVDTRGSNSGAASVQGTFTQFDFRERVRLDNPFLNPAARATIAAAILASGCNTSINTSCSGASSATSGPLSAAQRAAVLDGSYRFVIARNLSDVAVRDEQFRRDTYRIVGGLRGSFNDDWNYEISANYGRTEETTDTKGYFDKQRFNLSMDAGRNPVTGQIQCRSQFDPTAAVAGPDNAANRAKLAADIAACVPYNPFGAADNSAAGAYFSHPYHVDGWAEQLVLSGFVSGDSSQLFSLWGGPVRFALGAEYRQEDLFYAQDDFGASGNSTAVAFGSLAPPKFKVKEAFGELQIPVLANMPFFHELTLSGAARVARYQGATGTVWAYNGGADWAPIRDIRFRANYSKAVRAPNATETFGELVPNFAPGFNDPCATTQIGAGSQFRGANCQADLGALLPNVASRTNYSLPVLSGVNPNLHAETSKSLTIGGVLQPRFIPGFSLSVDYFDIKVKGVIVALTAQQIANSCYDQPTLNNPFCGLFQRFRGPAGTGAFNEVPGEIQGNTLIRAPLNFASRVRRGIDTQLNYRGNISDDVRFNANLIFTHNLKNSNYQDPTNPTFENRILGELGDPKNEFRLDTDLNYGPFTFGYRMRYIDSMWVNFYEDFNSLQGRPPQDADYSDIPKYPETFYHDIRFEWAIKRDAEGLAKDLNFYVGVDNVLNTRPPLGVAGTGGGGAGTDRAGGGTGNAAIYDVRGRRFYAGFKARF